jgi:hypothetical protein
MHHLVNRPDQAIRISGGRRKSGRFPLFFLAFACLLATLVVR